MRYVPTADTKLAEAKMTPTHNGISEDSKGKMGAARERRCGQRRPWLAIAALLWVWPPLGVFWGVLAVFFGPGKWKYRLFAVSVAGNVLFVFVLTLGYLATEADSHGILSPTETELVAPECVECTQDALRFCQAPRDSELARIVPHAVYVAFDGRMTARFEFVDERLDRLREVTISDEHGRPWIDAELATGRVIYSRYGEPHAQDPTESLIDEDGDGVPDAKVDWVLGQKFEHDGLNWRPVPRE